LSTEKILVIDDTTYILDLLSEYLKTRGYEVDCVTSGESGIAALGRETYDLVLSDLKMPGADGMDVLRFVMGHCPDTICIILTGHGSIKNAVEAVRAGAYDYLTKPVDLEEINIAVQRAIEFRNLKRENTLLRNQLRKKYKFENIIGDSPPMQKVFQTIEKVADTDSAILILGESGTGKELVARAIHYNSSRAKGPLVPVNCAAIPSELLESELFGHEKGAFTNAIRTRIGRFELAHGGTIFLDEIGDMDPILQSKLLRVLQDRAFERIGGTRTIQVDIRVITATHRNLKELVEQGRFREDLYYRLNVIPISIPSLRDHKSDIPLLIQHFLDLFNKSKKRDIQGVDPEAMKKLLEYDWPGNIRELENMIERIVILTNGEIITIQDLPERIQTIPARDRGVPFEIPEEGISLDSAVSEFERRLILQALNRTGWVKNKAAQLLNLNRTTLIEKIKRQNLQGPST
jgi:DNA-binding NtrC family response regulator